MRRGITLDSGSHHNVMPKRMVRKAGRQTFARPPDLKEGCATLQQMKERSPTEGGDGLQVRDPGGVRRKLAVPNRGGE